MAVSDVSITAANVSLRSDTTAKNKLQAGEALTAGILAYKQASDNKYYIADADAGSEEQAGGQDLVWVYGPAAANEYFTGITGGKVDVGGTVVKGEIYILSDTAGAFCLAEDIASTWYLSIFGYATSTSEILLLLNATGQQKA